MKLQMALHHDPSPQAWRSYRVRLGNDVRWFALRSDAERWLRSMLEQTV